MRKKYLKPRTVVIDHLVESCLCATSASHESWEEDIYFRPPSEGSSHEIWTEEEWNSSAGTRAASPW